MVNVILKYRRLETPCNSKVETQFVLNNDNSWCDHDCKCSPRTFDEKVDRTIPHYSIFTRSSFVSNSFLIFLRSSLQPLFCKSRPVNFETNLIYGEQKGRSAFTINLAPSSDSFCPGTPKRKEAPLPLSPPPSVCYVRTDRAKLSTLIPWLINSFPAICSEKWPIISVNLLITQLPRKLACISQCDECVSRKKKWQISIKRILFSFRNTFCHLRIPPIVLATVENFNWLIALYKVLFTYISFSIM